MQVGNGKAPIADGEVGTFLNKNGNKLYEGQFRDGWPHGQGEAFDIDGNLIYRGEWVNGFFEGEGKQFWL